MPVWPLDDPGERWGQPCPATSTWKPWGDDGRLKEHSNNISSNMSPLSTHTVFTIIHVFKILHPILMHAVKIAEQQMDICDLPSWEIQAIGHKVASHCHCRKVMDAQIVSLHCSALLTLYSKIILSHLMSKPMSLCITLWVLDANHVLGNPASKLSCSPTAWIKSKRKGA